MKSRVLVAVILFLLGSAAGFAADPDVQLILRTIDRQTNFTDVDFSSLLSVIHEDPEDGVDKSVVQQFRRDGQDKFVMLFLEPAVKKGQGYLRIDDNLWFYDPESRKFSHSSMKEQFGGTEAKNSDFGVSRLAEDYDLQSFTEDSLGPHPVYVLELQAKNSEVTYSRRRVWVTRERYLVLKSQDYSETGRLLRTSLYPSYSQVGGRYVPARLIFIDELVQGRKTSLTLSQVSLAPLPDSVFTKVYIERVNR